MISKQAERLSSTEHIKHSLETGVKGEQQFEAMCEAMGISYVPATQEQQFKHIDYIIAGNMKVDVKGLKNSHRYGYVIVELKNVQGKGGWCSEESEADFIAFDMGMFYHIVPRPGLLAHVKNIYTPTGRLPILTASKMPQYEQVKNRLYRRQDRQDLMMVIAAEELYQCPTYWLWRNRT